MTCEKVSKKEDPLIQISLSKKLQIFTGPNTEYEIDHEKIEQILLLPTSEQKLEGYLIFKCKESASGMAFLAVPSKKREEILKAIRPLERFLIDDSKLPGFREFLSVDTVNRFVGEILNPELEVFPK